MARLRTSDDSPENPQQERNRDRRRRPKIIVPLNDGKPDCSILSDEAKAALRKALAESEPEPPPPTDPSIVLFAVRAVASIEAAIVAPRMGVPLDRARECLQPNPILEQQIAAAGARVLDKHSAIMGRYGDEIVLLSLLIAWQAQAFTALRAARESVRPQQQASPEPPERPPVIDPRASAPVPEPDSGEPVPSWALDLVKPENAE